LELVRESLAGPIAWRVDPLAVAAKNEQERPLASAAPDLWLEFENQF